MSPMEVVQVANPVTAEQVIEAVPAQLSVDVPIGHHHPPRSRYLQNETVNICPYS